MTILGIGCFGGAAPRPSAGAGVPPTAGASKGTLTGRVSTRVCAGPAANSCTRIVYRGSLVFCRTMDEIGPCPSARVDATGHYRITLMPGRWAMIPAPWSGNVAGIEPRWVSVPIGKTETLNVEGSGSVLR